MACASCGGWGPATLGPRFRTETDGDAAISEVTRLVGKGKESMAELTVAFQTSGWSGTRHFCSCFFGQVTWPHGIARGWGNAIPPCAWGENQNIR